MGRPLKMSDRRSQRIMSRVKEIEFLAIQMVAEDTKPRVKTSSLIRNTMLRSKAVQSKLAYLRKIKKESDAKRYLWGKRENYLYCRK